MATGFVAHHFLVMIHVVSSKPMGYYLLYTIESLT